MPLRFFFALLLLIPESAGAQLASLRTRTEPVGFISAGAGLYQLNRIVDASTEADWRFESTIQYRAAVELALRNQSAFGVAGTYARVPLRYYQINPFAFCRPCEGNATVWTALAFFRAGGGSGFHQIIELGIGATGYQDFETEGGDVLPPNPDQSATSEADIDITLSVGYGFGYGFGNRTQIFLVQSADQSLHQSGDNPNVEGTTSVQHYVTRVGLRYGFGTRRSY